MLYYIHNYQDNNFYLEDCTVKSQSIVDFGTAMINKHKSKKNKRRK